MKLPKMLILSIFSFTIPGHISWTQFPSPSIWEYSRYKISLTNIETGSGITTLDWIFNQFLIGSFFSNNVIEYVIKIMPDI